MSRIWKVLTRKKAIDPVTAEETRLSRVLNVFDLTALGVGSTLGVGVYLLAGQVAKNTAGPSVVLSFLIAAVASVFAGLCYAEFGARAPRAGSAYIYSYVCVGEFVAFVIGWNLILEYVIGSASVARGISLYLDTLINNTLQDTFREIAPIHVPYLASYFDFFSFGISILLAIGLAFGLKESSMANNVVTCLNILIVLFIIIAGSTKADPANWHISPNNTNGTNSTIIGSGGFFPFGVDGMIKGAATCFYGFVGFDCIATTGEEVKNPRKAIPVSIVVSLFIIFLAYFGVSTVLTLMVPYYLQDFNAPIPKAFESIGWDAAKWIVAIGALFGLFASLFGAMFPLPRIIYAMGSDGLVFKFLAKVHPKFQTPVVGTLLAGCLTGLMSALFDLSQLVNMMSIGTLQAYTIVAASVLLLRYTEEVKKVYIPIKTSSDTESVSSESSVDDKYNDDGVRQNFDGPTTNDEQELIASGSPGVWRSLKHFINCSVKEPTRITENIVTFEVLLYCILCIGIGLCVMYLKTNMANGEAWAIAITSVIVSFTVLVLVSLVTQPKSKKELSFKVPLVPLIPALSIMVNIYLMLMLDYRTWVRFGVWMTVGIPVYCICACTEKSPLKPQNGLNYATNITNGHSKIPNGISNQTFVLAESDGQEMKQKTTKKKAPPPPPTIFEQTESIEVQQEAVIADLEEILEKEEAIAQLDDVLNNATDKINERKLSAGSLSNGSAVASHSEDVVADVHCANVVTPVATPDSPPFPIRSDTKPDSELVEMLDGDFETTAELPVDKNTDNKKSDSLADTNDEIIKTIEVNDDVTHNEQLVEVILTTKSPDIDSEEILPPPPVPNTVEIPDTSFKPTLTIPSVGFAKDDLVISSPVPTEEALKTVTLRHVKKQIKQIEPTDNQNASDDNLKVGSNEYMSFIKDLDSKLTRTSSVLPTYYVPRKDVTVQPKPVIPTSNENVIEDHIDRGEAREKLKQFYASQNAAKEPSSPRPVLNGSKSVFEDTVSKIEPNSTVSKNVFDTIKPKKLETEDQGRFESKSLGSSFLRDGGRTEHKENMADVFKSIRGIKKDSVA